MPIEFARVSVTELIEEAITINASYGEQFNVSFKFNNLTQNTFLYGDETRLQQVLANLLSNAAKFSNPGCAVIIESKPYNSGTRISVIDTGEGMPHSYQTHVFDKFTQADSSDTRRVGGTGLGLNIVKLIVEKHLGTVSFKSMPGMGTTFYLDFPAYEDAVIRLQPAAISQLKNE
jgi:signal transduction histidine kinase